MQGYVAITSARRFGSSEIRQNITVALRFYRRRRAMGDAVTRRLERSWRFCGANGRSIVKMMQPAGIS
jgi:hypothetical protein